MRRRLTKLVVFLLLGAIINVAVAWILAVTIYVPYPRTGDWEYIGGRVDGRVGFFDLWRLSRFGTLGVFTVRRQTKVTGLTGLSLPDEPKVIRRGSDPADSIPTWLMEFDSACSEMKSGSSRAGWRWAIAHGWPFLSVWGEHEHVHVLLFGRPAENKTLRGSLRTPLPPWRNGLPREVSFLPIWSGVVANTLFYAALVWLISFGRLQLRRFMRNKRGHCIKCGYDLRHAEHEQCPECGLAIPLRITIRS